MDENERLEKLREQANSAQARIDGLRDCYAALNQYLSVQIEKILPLTNETPKSQTKKLEELQTLQVTLMKAEEAFNEKFRPDDGDDIDYDALRVEIGRALDRIREAERAVEFFEQPDKSTD